MTDEEIGEPVAQDASDRPSSMTDEVTVVAQMAADISDQWSWASSAARIPQIFDLTVALSEEVEHARINVTVSDADLQFGSKIAFEGRLAAGTTLVGSVHVPLSARLMSQVEERRGARCGITLEEAATGRVLARIDEDLGVLGHQVGDTTRLIGGWPSSAV